MSKRIDINCDLGEGCENDVELLKHITSANVACGFHAGDAMTMSRIGQIARKCRSNIGAHVSFPDRENFGRKKIFMPGSDIEKIVLYQIGALAALAGNISHVKAHGALYHAANEDSNVAAAIGRAIKAYGKVFWIAQDGCQQLVAKKMKIQFAREAFADRRYLPDGTLVPRGQPGALITDPAEAGRQAVALASNADTICIHSDSPRCVEIARAVSATLAKSGFRVSAFK